MEKKLLGGLKCILQLNTEMNLKEIRCFGVDEIVWFRIGRAERSREGENETYVSAQWDRPLDYLMNCQLFMKDSSPRSQSLGWYGVCFSVRLPVYSKIVKLDTYNTQ